jgi:hypothetical protein
MIDRKISRDGAAGFAVRLPGWLKSRPRNRHVHHASHYVSCHEFRNHSVIRVTLCAVHKENHVQAAKA